MRFLITAITMLFCVTVQAADTPDVTLQPYEFKTRGGETVQAELGDLIVPESRDGNSKRQIHLRFVRFVSTAKDRKTPIVYLAGGPGGSGIDAARGARFPLFMAMRQFGDVIAFDQRGTGMSEPDLSCKETYMLPLSEPTDKAKAGKIIAGASQQCFERLRKEGIDLSAYNTRESAADLNDLRIALGASRISLWGISYGTHLALAAMKYHGESIDRVILAGVEPLHHTCKLPADQEALLQMISSLSRKDPKVNQVVPDLTNSIRALIKKLDQQPETVSLTHPLNGMTAEVTVGSFDLQFAVAQMLGGPEAFSALPDFIGRLEKGDWIALALFSAQARVGRVPSAMTTAMDCASGADAEWRRKIAEQAKTSILGDAINFPFPEICEGLPELGDDFRKRFSSEIPALLISGTLDGRTPPSNANEVAGLLKNSKQLVIDGAGHSDPLFLSSPVILDAMKAFMGGAPLPAQQIAVKPDPFIAPRTVVTLPEEALNRYAGVYQIAEGVTRRVIKAGSILWTQREQGNPLPIRPMSETEFFYEGSPAWLRFDVKPAAGSEHDVVTGSNFEFAGGQWFNGKQFAPATFFSVNGILTMRKPEKVDHKFDLSGKYVVPPFGEAHNHNIEQSSRLDSTIRSYLEAGIFYVKNPNNLPRSRTPLTKKINNPENIDVTFANGGLTSTGGHPVGLVERNLERGIWTSADGEGAFYFAIDTKEELDQKWNTILAGKPDFIKTFLLYSEEYEKRKNDESYKAWRGLNPGLLPDIVARAHAAGLRVSTHVETAADFHNALVAGVDEINHLPGFRPEKDDPASYANLQRYEISDDDAKLAGRRQVVVVTTVGGVIEYILRVKEESPQAKLASEVLELLKRNLRKLHENAVPLAIGSDSYEETSLNEAMSLKRLEVFDNFTLLKMWCEDTPRTIFPQRKIGELREGYEASFLALNGNPLEDFANVQNIHLRVKQGHIIPIPKSDIAVTGMTVFQGGKEPGEQAPKIPNGANE